MSKKKQTPKQSKEQPEVQAEVQPKKYNWMVEAMMKEDWWVEGLRKTDPTKDTYQISFLAEVDPKKKEEKKKEEKKKTDEWEPTWEDIARLADLFRNHR